MIESLPMVSIGMPVYNGEKYIRQALNSLLSQSYTNFELIISDNASTDGTQEICRDYAKSDERITYHRCVINNGAAWNFNRVFELSSGKYFAWACPDDYWDPSYIHICLEAFKTSTSIVLAGTFCESLDPESREVICFDSGFSTIGMNPHESFIRCKEKIYGLHGKFMGGIFYGLYSLKALKIVMPVRKVIGNDHLILAGLCFQGQFITIEEKLMVKRLGGASVSHRSNARAQGLRNPVLIKFPYFVREIFLQAIIICTDNLTVSKKVRLALWSFATYIKFCLIRKLCRSLSSFIKCSLRRTLPVFIKRPMKRLLNYSTKQNKTG